MRNTSTPIINAVRAMHADEDKGRDPYNARPLVRRAPVVNPTTTKEQRDEAAQILKCYETELEVLP